MTEIRTMWSLWLLNWWWISPVSSPPFEEIGNIGQLHDMFTLCNKSNPCPTMHAAPGGILTNTLDNQLHLQSPIITNPCIGTFKFNYTAT